MAEDWELARLGMRAVLQPLGLRVLAECGLGREALRLVEAGGVDLLLLGGVPDVAPAEAVRRAKQAASPPLVVTLAPQVRRDEVVRLLGVGVDGLLVRSTGAAELGAAVGRVLAGERVVAPAFLALLVGVVDLAAPAGAAAERDPLTGKEREVLARLAEGRSNRGIAAALCVTPATVKTHLAHIYDKLGARDRHDALLRAVSLGLLDGAGGG